MLDEYERAICRAADGLDEPALPLGLGWQRVVDRAPPKRDKRANPNARLRKAYASKGDDTTFSRFVKQRDPHAPTQADLLNEPRTVSPRLANRPYVAEGRTKFPKSVREPGDHVLVSGHSNAKLGRDVRKGRLFRGYWIYALTLQERATCPSSCHHWATCYGNGMPYASRIDHTDQAALKIAIERDVERLLAVKGRAGILVRLHALGDFFDPRYVSFWAGLLNRHPRLAVFGYTAWPPESPVGRAVGLVKAQYGRRFAIRWSNGTGATDAALPVRAVDEPVNAIVCPEQIGRTRGCGTCGFCWNSDRNVAFLEH